MSLIKSSLHLTNSVIIILIRRGGINESQPRRGEEGKRAFSEKEKREEEGMTNNGLCTVLKYSTI